jgi:hypothetical protein
MMDSDSQHYRPGDKAGSDAMKGSSYILIHSLHVAAALQQMSGSNAD